MHCNFLLEKCENLLQCKIFSHFPTKSNSVFDNILGIYLMSRQDVIRLTTLRTTVISEMKPMMYWQWLIGDRDSHSINYQENR